MKSKLVLVLWCINLCLKLAASIPFVEDSAQYLVGAQHTSVLASDVLEDNAHSRLENVVALRHSFTSDAILPSGIGDVQQVQIGRVNQRGDSMWHAVSRASGFPAASQNMKEPAYYQEVHMPYTGGSLRAEAPLHQIPTGQSQVIYQQQNPRLPGPPMQQLPFTRQNPVDTLQNPFVRQPVLRQVVEGHQLPFIREPEVVRLPFIREPEAVRLPFIRGPIEAQVIQQHPRLPDVPTVAPTRQLLEQMNQQVAGQPFPPKPFVPFSAEPLERSDGKPTVQIASRPLFTQHSNKQELPGLGIEQKQDMNTMQQKATNDELKKIAEGKSTSRYVVVYPNGTTEYVNQIESIAQKYPNYSIINGYGSNASKGQLSQIQNDVGQRPPYLSQHVKNVEAQLTVNDNVENKIRPVRAQTQNNVTQTHAQNYEAQNQTQTQKLIEITTYVVDVAAAESMSSPSQFEIEQVTENIEPQVSNTSYPNSNLRSKSESEPQITEPQPNNYIKQLQGTTEGTTESSYEMDQEDDVVVQTEYTITLLESHPQEQPHSKLSAMDNLDAKQKPTVLPPVTQSSTSLNFSGMQKQVAGTAAPDEHVISLQNVIKNNYESSNEDQELVIKPSPTDSDSNEQPSEFIEFFDPDSNDTTTEVPDLAFIKLNPRESGNNENSSNSQHIAFEEPMSTESGNNKISNEVPNEPQNNESIIPADPDKNVTKKDSAHTTENQNVETNRNDRSTAFSESPSQNESKSLSNNTKLSNTTSEPNEKTAPYTWFSTSDPDFFTKMMGRDVFGLVYFFMVPSNAPKDPDDARV